jgi:putative transposase
LKKRFSVEQIRGYVEVGRTGSACCGVDSQARISEQTFYQRKKQYVGMKTDQARQMKRFQEENNRLKQLVADPSLVQVLRFAGRGYQSNTPLVLRPPPADEEAAT